MTAPEPGAAAAGRAAGRTPEQAAHAAACEHEGVGSEAPELWQLLNVRELMYWKAVAQAAVNAQIAGVLAVADGGTVVVAFRQRLTRAEGAEVHERWARFGPKGVKIAILDDVAAIAAQEPQPAPGLAALAALIDAMHALAGTLNSEADDYDGGYTDGLRYAAQRITDELQHHTRLEAK